MGGVQYHNTVPEHEDNPTPPLINPGNQDQPTHGEGIENNQGQNNHGENGEDQNSSSGRQPEDEPHAQSIPSPSNSSQPQVIPNTDEENTGDHGAEISPAEIHVPSDDDELMCDIFVEEEDCFHLQEDVGWHFEVNIAAQDIERWRGEDEPHHMAFLVSAAKRQRSEVKMHQLSNEEKQLFQRAKDKEIDSWLSTETVCRILRNQIPQENIMRCRWILTWKPTDEGDANNSKNPQQYVPKARLVVLGYEDPLVHEIPRDSPTMSKLARMLILQFAASKHWNIESFDIKTAFLRGEEHSSRVLGLEPPSELREKMKLAPQESVQVV